MGGIETIKSPLDNMDILKCSILVNLFMGLKQPLYEKYTLYSVYLDVGHNYKKINNEISHQINVSDR